MSEILNDANPDELQKFATSLRFFVEFIENIEGEIDWIIQVHLRMKKSANCCGGFPGRL
jgi:hypothetical protein